MAASHRLYFSSLIALVAFLSISIDGVHAQTTNATCLSGYEWMSNSKAQPPCLITAYLITPCLANPADAFVNALPDGFHYRPPVPASATACQCNTVFYSMIQACAVCQGDPIVPWSTWNMNCTSAIYVSKYPEPIPSGTSVPAWAYLDVSAADNFNATAAQIDESQGHPESTAGNNPTSVGGPTPTETAGASSSHSNTGAIVGGVVGGVGGAAILAAVAFFLWRKYRGSKASVSFDTQALAPGLVPDGGEKAQYTPVAQPVPVSVSMPSPTSGYNTLSVYSTGKVYDPNDPSTFPSAMLDPSGQSTMSYGSPLPAYPSSPGQYQVQPGTPTGKYRGVPEV